MTKIYTTKVTPPKPAEIKTVVDYILCDVCKEAKGYENYHGEIEWESGCYEIKNTVIKWEEGHSYPESSWSTIKESHICPTCLEFTVAPLLKEHLRIEPHESEKDW